MKALLTKRKLWFLLLLLAPMMNYAQEATVATSRNSYFSNALFNTLLVVIILLLVIIAALGNALKKLVQSDYFKERIKKAQEAKSANATTIKSVLFILFMSSFLYSQAATGSSTDEVWKVGGLDMTTFFVLIGIILFEFSIIAILYNLIIGFVKTDKEPVAKKEKVKKRTILERLNASVEIEKEKDILLDHDYDGIRELDNNLPPWWRYGFYVTIVFALIYMVNYHVTKTGDLQQEEYDKSIVQAKAEIEAYMKTAANNVDETNVKMLEGADLTSGKDIFTSNCAACHGKEGQGGVGPNLTDAYWLHGGGLPDVFKSIKYGWVDKGMKSWKEDLSPVQIAQLSSFIRSIAGTNPAGAKAPQGDLYKEELNSTGSTQAKADTVLIVPDTLKLK